MAVGVNIVSTFDSKGIQRAIKDFQKLDGAGNKSAFALKTFDQAASNGIKNLAKMGAAAGIAAGAIGYKLASAAYESQKVMAQTEAVIKATGGAAGVTAKQVSDLSEKLAMQIGVDDELIQTSANLLLTFKQVQNQVGLNNNIFDQAVILSQDLGNVFGSADAAAMQLGKALSDPEKGITALRRAGINFTDAQKEQIKTLVQSGDVLGAQKLILAEVESQVGGTAAATATGFDIMRVAIGNVAEEFGAILIPYIEKFATFVTTKVVPYLSNLADVLGEGGVGAAIKLLAEDFLNMTTNMGKTGNIILGIATAFLMLKAATIAFTIAQSAATIATAAFGIALNATGIGLVAAAIAAVVIGLIALYVKFEVVRKAVGMFGDVLKFVFVNTVTAVQNYFISFINLAIMGVNILIKAANLFGADIEEVGLLGYKAFTGIGNAAETASKKIGASQKSIDTYGSRLDALAAKYGKVKTGTDGAFGGGGGGAAKTVETAAEKLQKYIDKLKGLTQAQRSYRDSQKGVLKADTDLLEAKTKLADAQAYMNQVLKGYGAGSKQAKDRQKELDKAQRGVERSNYDVEGAVFAVKDAEAELAKLRADPESSAQAIREAEISLAEAKLAVADATDSQTDATNELSTAQLLLQEAISGASESSDTYLEAAKALKDAQIAERDATDQQTAAYERQKDALDALTKAQEEATAAKKGVKPADAAAAEAAANAPVTGGGFGLDQFAYTGAGGTNAFGLTQAQVEANFAAIDFSNLFPSGFTAFADGGVVTSPMMGLVGEAGSEAIIPLDRLGEFGGQTINITINAGIGTDAAAVGDEIVNVLQRYNRRNGALPLKVA
jgi:hypothetical protein